MILIYIGISASIIILLGLFFILIPLLKINGQLSKQIRDTTSRKLLEYNKTIITLSSGIIAFTIGFVPKTESIKLYLKLSWIFFIITISIGIIIFITDYLLSLHNEIKMRLVSEMLDKSNTDKNKLIKQGLEFKKISKAAMIYEMILFVLVTMQFCTFLLSLLALLQIGIYQ